MKITFNRKIIFMASCMMLVACAGETRAQQESASKEKTVAITEENLPLEQKCRQLSEKTGEGYQVVSGEAKKVGIAPRSPADCFEGGCPELSQTNFYAILSPLNIENSDADFVVYTEKEEREILVKKKPYMEEKKQFSFCAQEIEGSRQYHKGQRAFNIISSTIRETSKEGQ